MNTLFHLFLATLMDPRALLDVFNAKSFNISCMKIQFLVLNSTVTVRENFCFQKEKML